MLNMNQGEISMQQNKVETLEADSSKAVAVLLNQYSTYLELEKILKINIDHRKKTQKKFSFQGGSVQYMGDAVKLTPTSREEIKLEQKNLSDAAKFQNPLIWLEFKRKAYIGEPENELLTLADIVRHTSKDGVCHRRFDAINLYLRRKYEGKDMTSSAFIDQSMSLLDVGKDSRFIDMCLDNEFMNVWSENENSKSGKWKDYVLTSPDHDCEINCTC